MSSKCQNKTTITYNIKNAIKGNNFMNLQINSRAESLEIYYNVVHSVSFGDLYLQII